jgi:hypothetical protein
MRSRKLSAYAFATTLAIGVLAACAGGGHSVLPGAAPGGAPLEALDDARRQAWLHPNAPEHNGPGWLSPDSNTGPVLFVGNYQNATIELFRATQKAAQPIGLISKGLVYPSALAVDGFGNLYAANEQGPPPNNGPGNVVMYLVGSRTPSRIYTQGIAQPVGIAVGADGTVYVANYNAPQCCGGSVAVYPPGSTTPSTVLTDLNGNNFAGVAVDAAGNVYVPYVGNNCCPQTVGIEEFLVGDPIPADLGITLGPGYNVPENPALDRSGNIAAVLAGQSIGVYPPGATSPTHTFGPRGNPGAVAFNKIGNRLYVADYGASEIEEYAYPSGTLVNLFQNAMRYPESLALRPAEPLPTRSPQPPPPTPTPTPSPTPTPVPTPPPGTLYAGILNQSPNSVTLFDAQSFSQQSQITQGVAGPRGLAFDSQGNLYVTTFIGNSGAVNVYPPGQSSPSTTYTQGLGQTPWGVAVGPDGSVYVVNNYEPTNVVVYGPGGTTQTATLNDPNFVNVYAIAADSAGNTYVSFYSSSTNNGQIDEFPAGSTTPVTLPMAVSGQVLGIAVDASGDLIVADGSEVDVFPPGASSPSQVIGRGQFGEASGVALDATESFLYVGDLPYGNVYVYTYPAGNLIGSFSAGSNVYVFSLILSPTPPLGSPFDLRHRLRLKHAPARQQWSPRTVRVLR